MDLIVLLFFCCNVSIKKPISHLAFLKFSFCMIQFISFSKKLIEGSNGQWDVKPFVLSLFGFMVETVVEVGASLKYGMSGHAAGDCRLG
jgi:hypothetical protein